MTRDVKPVIIDPFFSEPGWLALQGERREFVILDGSSTAHDADLFLILLFGYNAIETNGTALQTFRTMLELDGVALSGGAVFRDADRMILPSCCCGLEGWQEIEEAVRDRKSPWMGHDPTPGMVYGEGDTVTVWSDDPNETGKMHADLFSMTYTREELLVYLAKARTDLQSFLDGPLRVQIEQYCPPLADETICYLKQVFLEAGGERNA